MNDIATCTILVVACLSWPCFLDSNRICSLSRPQSPESLDIVIMATRSLEVDARSEACVKVSAVDRKGNMGVLLVVFASQALIVSLSLLVHFSVTQCVSKKSLVKHQASNTLASSSASGICLSASFV